MDQGIREATVFARSSARGQMAMPSAVRSVRITSVNSARWLASI
jgi:hypothetical protein